MDIIAADLDRPAAGPQRSGDAPEESCFPASVGTKDRQDLPSVYVQIDAIKDLAFAVTEARAPNANQRIAYCHVPLVRRSRYAKYGAPMIAVRIPIGISPAVAVLATSSITSR